MDGKFSNKFVFDLQRFDFTKADSAPDGALFSVTKVENGETKTYYGTEDADFSTDNLSEATAIELLGDLTVKTAFSTSATISIRGCW